MKFTQKMLNAMLTALSELLAGEGPQGYNENSEEAEEIMKNAEKAHQWIHEELERRKDKK